MARSPVGFLVTAARTSALLLAAGCCRPCERPCGSTSAAALGGASGTIAVTSVPAGDVWIDGRPAGYSPVEATAGEGSHQVTIRLGGFEESVQTVNVASGGRTAVEARLVASDLEDRQVLQMLAQGATLAKGAKVWVEPYEAPPTLRGDPSPTGTAAVYPRGPVRIQDLKEFRVDFGTAPAAGGVVDFRLGDDVLSSVPVDATVAGAWIRPVPGDIALQLLAGHHVTWGYHPKAGPAVEATFTVVEQDLSDSIAAVDQAVKGQPKAAAGYLHIQVLSDAGLAYAAHQEARKLVQEGLGTVRAWAAVLDTLAKMGAPKETLAWREAQAQVGAFSRQTQLDALPGADAGPNRVLEHMRNGQAGRALMALDKEQMSALSQSASKSRGVAYNSAAYARRMAEQSPGAERRFAEAMLAMANAAAAAAPKEPDARWAVSFAQVGRARALQALGDKPKLDGWKDAARTVLGVYDLGADDEGRAYAQATAWLREAAGVAEKDQRGAVLDAAADLAARARKAFPGTPSSTAASVTALLARAEYDPPSSARDRALEGIALLKPLLAEDPVDPSIATLHTDLVTLDIVRGLRLGLDYRTESHVTAEDLTKFDLPASSRWRVVKEMPDGYAAYVEELGDDGDVRRAIAVRVVQWGSDYKFPGGGVAGGENTQMLAKQDLEGFRRSFTKLKQQGHVEKSKFSKNFPRADAYEVYGTHLSGAYHRVRGWAMKSEKMKVSFLVTIEDFEEIREDGPELEIFRESFTDIPSKK